MFKMTILLVFLGFGLTNLPNSLPLSHTVIDSQTRAVLTRIVEKYFIEESTLGLLLPNLYMDRTFDWIHVPIFIYNQENLIANCQKANITVDGYIFVISDISSLTTQIVDSLKCFNKTTLKLNTKKVLIVEITSKSDVQLDHNIYLQYFHWLWRKFGLIHLVILPIYEINGNFYSNSTLAYNPFMTQSPLEPGTLLKLDLSDDLLYNLDNRFLNMYQYPLNAVMFPFNLSVHPLLINHSNDIRGGPDLSFRWALESHFNVSFVIHRPRDNGYHGFIVNGTPTGSLADIIDNCGEITINVKRMMWYSSPKVQFLVPRTYASLIIMVEKKGRILGWQLILHVFRYKVWLWFMVAIIVCCVIAQILVTIQSVAGFSNTRHIKMSFAGSFVFKSILSITVLKVPQNDSERVLMTVCLCCSVVILNAFFGQLFYLIKSKPQLTNINTLQELQDSNLPIVTPYANFLDAFDGFQNSTLSKLKSRLKYVSKEQKKGWDNGYPNNITENFAILYSSLLINFQAVAESTQFLQKVHFLKEHVLEFPLGQLMPIGSIFYNQFNLFSMRLHEFGFFQKWEFEYFVFIREQNKHRGLRNKTTRNYLEHLTLNDLRISFFILCLGFMISIMCFVGEMYLIKISRKFS